MSERQWSLADRFVCVAAELQKMDYDNDNPHRYPLRKMKQAAEKALYDAITTASNIIEAARVLNQEIDALDARKQP